MAVAGAGVMRKGHLRVLGDEGEGGGGAAYSVRPATRGDVSSMGCLTLTTDTWTDEGKRPGGESGFGKEKFSESHHETGMRMRALKSGDYSRFAHYPEIRR
jgi:hypothetical protein